MNQQLAWSETCFKRVEDSGVIHMAVGEGMPGGVYIG